MKKILVPTDFSPCASNAMRYAIELAARTTAEITALHVIYPNDGLNNNLYDAFWIDDYVTQRNKDLKDWAQKLVEESSHPEVSIHTSCNIGFPVGVVADTAAEMGAALIIMGTTGATGLKGILLGSTAGGVIVNSQNPVLSIPPNAQFKTHETFVLATDFKMRTDVKSRNALAMVLRAHEATLNVLHVLREDEAVKTTYESEISRNLEDIQHSFHYIHDNDVPNAIDNFIESTRAGGVVAIAHNHSLMHQVFYKSVSRALAGRVQVPMLSLHDAK